MSDTENNLQGWVGHDLVDETGAKIGRVDEIYVDEDTRQPEWLAVTTGFFGTNVSFVPVNGLTADGDQLVAPWDKDMVKGAPHAEADGQLSPDEEDSLYSYYGRTAQGNRIGRTDPGTDTSGPSTDSAVTRSEEELRVSTTEREAGRVRLRKYIETEHQTVTVPVRKERVEVIREPITDSNRDAAMSGPDLSEEEHEMVLSEEQVVVDTQVVPKERVRLDKEVDVTDERVEADIRKERIEIDGDLEETTPSTH